MSAATTAAGATVCVLFVLVVVLSLFKGGRKSDPLREHAERRMGWAWEDSREDDEQ